MVQPAEHGKPHDRAIEPGSGAFIRDWNLLAHPLMRPSHVEVVDRILREDVPQVSLSQNDHVIEAFAPDAAQKSLAHRIHQGSLYRCAQNANPGALGDAVEDRAELVVTIANDELRALPERRRIAELLRRPRLRRSARHRNVDDALGVHIDDEEREDRTEPDVVGLQEVARPDGVVS